MRKYFHENKKILIFYFHNQTEKKNKSKRTFNNINVPPAKGTGTLCDFLVEFGISRINNLFPNLKTIIA